MVFIAQTSILIFLVQVSYCKFRIYWVVVNTKFTIWPLSQILLIQNYKLTQACFVSYLFEIGSGVLKIFFKKKGFHSYATWIVLMCQLWKWFLKAINVFSLFRNFLPLKGVAFHVNRLDMISLYPKVLCAKFDQESLSGSGEYSQMLTMYFSYFSIIARLERVDFSFAKAVLCLFWLKLFQLVWRRRWRCERFTDRQTDRQTDKRRPENLTGASSSVKQKIVRLINMSRQYHWRDMKRDCSLAIYNKPFDANSTSRQENFIYTCTTILTHRTFVLKVRKDTKKLSCESVCPNGFIVPTIFNHPVYESAQKCKIPSTPLEKIHTNPYKTNKIETKKDPNK